MRTGSFLVLCTIMAAPMQAQGFEFPAWAFPLTTPGGVTAKASDPTMLLHVPGSTRAFTRAQTRDLLNPADWFPESHAPAPDVVIHGRKEVKYGCGLCHLPDGQGRSENATIVGLNEAYFVRQINDMRSGARGPAASGWPSATFMADVAKAITDEEAIAAAKYFGAMKAKPRYRVVERERIPGTYQAGGLLAVRVGADSESLAGRLMEVSNDIERHELRDPGETFTTYVPPGSIARGRSIALSAKIASPTRCATCHGAELRGTDVAPPIAGRSPAYLLRQLIGFKSGARVTSTSLPMQIVTSNLTLADMIAVVAFAGSERP